MAGGVGCDQALFSDYYHTENGRGPACSTTS
jgi:hypothetical protein